MQTETRPKNYPKLKSYQPTRFMLATSHYDRKKADKAVNFIEQLCHTKSKWAGHRFWLLPWQEQIIRDVFGIVNGDGTRQFRTAFVEIPKKNGKSELAAAIALYLLYADGEASPEVYGAASDRQQASIVFDVARRMVEQNKALMKRSKIMTAQKRLVNYHNAGYYQVLSAEVNCVLPQTCVLMLDGTEKPAEEVRAGDILAAYNGFQYVGDKVVSVEEQEESNVLEIATVDGMRIGVTGFHPFWCVCSGGFDWVCASELKHGDWIVRAEKQESGMPVIRLAEVEEVRSIGKKRTISIEMEKYQTHVTNGFITHNTKHGLNVSGLVFDELHSLPTRALYDVLTKGASDARQNPLAFIITTAGTDKNSIGYEVHMKAKDILEGRRVDPTFYPVIYGIEDGDDFGDEKNWYKANPSLDITIPVERMRDAYRDAKDNPAEENLFRQLRLDQWVASTVRWIPEHIYEQGSLPIDMKSLEGRECYGGLDLSSSGDITAFVLCFPPRNSEEKYIILPFMWVPEDTIPLRVRRASVPYDVWVQQGYMLATEGNVIDYGFIEHYIDELGKKYHILEIAFDRWGAVEMVQHLEGENFTVVPFGQGYKDMSPATKAFYELLMKGDIIHGGHPVLKWMAGNVVIDTDPAGNIKPTKAKSAEKIDGIVAAIMALDRCIRHEEQGSVYDDRELFVI